jgi:hypothetical protein
VNALKEEEQRDDDDDDLILHKVKCDWTTPRPHSVRGTLDPSGFLESLSLLTKQEITQSSFSQTSFIT